MSAAMLARQLQMNHWAAHANLEGLTHEDSLIHPTAGAV